MSDSMISRTIDVMKMYDFDCVRIFCNKKLNIKSLAPAFALRDFLRYINIDAEIIIEKNSHLPDEFKDVLTKPDKERYLSFTVDCQKESDIENDFYRKTTTLLNCYSPQLTKGYGVLNFKRGDVGGTSEYMVGEFVSYCEENNLEFPILIAEWLYLGIIAATRRFGTCIRKNTMSAAKQLIDMGIDYARVNYIYEKYDLRAIRSQEIILNNLVEMPHYVYAVLPLKEYADKFTYTDFVKAINLFKNIDNCYLTALFVEQPDGFYKFILKTNEHYKANIRLIARKSNGDGNDETAEATIQKFDFNRVIEDIELACSRIEDREEDKL